MHQEPEFKTTTIRFPAELHRTLTAYAKQQGFTLQHVVVMFLLEQAERKGLEPSEDPEFWPSGWPRAYVSPRTGGVCNICIQSHDPMEHSDNRDNPDLVRQARLASGLRG